MKEDFLKDLESGLKGIDKNLSVVSDPRSRYHFMKYGDSDVGTLDSSSMEAGLFPNGNVPSYVHTGVEKFLLDKKFRVSSPFLPGEFDN